MRDKRTPTDVCGEAMGSTKKARNDTRELETSEKREREVVGMSAFLNN